MQYFILMNPRDALKNKLIPISVKADHKQTNWCRCCMAAFQRSKDILLLYTSGNPLHSLI